jgi:hypothetical protein
MTVEDTFTEPDLADMFADNAGWQFAPPEMCKLEKIWPNRLCTLGLDHCAASAGSLLASDHAEGDFISG